jgi:hypothetical protein
LIYVPTYCPPHSASKLFACSNMAQDKQHTVFFHPDLGIGGAERLVVDAAVALQERGHKVTIFTSHCDPRHCFDEARDGKPPPHLTTPAYASTRRLERNIT